MTPGCCVTPGGCMTRGHCTTPGHCKTPGMLLSWHSERLEVLLSGEQGGRVAVRPTPGELSALRM